MKKLPHDQKGIDTYQKQQIISNYGITIHLKLASKSKFGGGLSLDENVGKYKGAY